jgi:outer membrane translocation and assembly module TamA
MRKTLGPKWAGVAFFDSIQVAPSLAELQLRDFHYSTGLGVRFATTPDRFNIRLDVGWVDAQNLNFAITVGEAF